MGVKKRDGTGSVCGWGCLSASLDVDQITALKSCKGRAAPPCLRRNPNLKTHTLLFRLPLLVQISLPYAAIATTTKVWGISGICAISKTTAATTTRQRYQSLRLVLSHLSQPKNWTFSPYHPRGLTKTTISAFFVMFHFEKS